jgi:heme o synthase
VVALPLPLYSYVMVAATLVLAPYAGWLYTASAAGLGVWFLLEAHRLQLRVARIARTGDAGQPAAAAVAAAAPVAGGAAASHGPAVTEGACAGVVQPSANPAPMRLFHLSIAYLTLLFAVIAVTSLLPWGSW